RRRRDRAVREHRARPRPPRLLHGEGRDPLRRTCRRAGGAPRPAAVGLPRRRGEDIGGWAGAMTILGLHLSGPVIVLGAITGMVYGILAVGLVLVYRSSRIINFAHGQIGAFGAALLGVAVVKW